MQTDVEVIVLGGGPVGLTTALLLAEQDTRVALVEMLLAPSDLPRAISLADESFRILDGLGLADPLKEEAYLDTGARYFGLRGRLLAESMPAPSRSGHPAKSQFDQPVLEQLLWDRVEAHANVDLMSGHRATGINQDAETVTVTVQAPDGVMSSVSAHWLAAADGGRSFARDELGVPLVGSTQEERWLVIDLLNVPGKREPFAEFHGNGARPLVLVPGVKNRLRLEYMMLPSDDEDEITRPERIRELVLPYHPGVQPEDIRRAAVYVAHRRVAKTYRVGRAFLVGDAAHLMPPFSGQGLNAGMRDAVNLSWKLRAALDGHATDKLLDSYETERRAHAKKMVTVSHLTGSVVMARGTAALLRDVAFRAAKLVPPVRSYLSGMRFITPPNHRDGVAVTPLADVQQRLAAMVGMPLPQPLVAGPDGERSLLDRHLGRGWALVELGPGAPVAAAGFGDRVNRVRLLPATERADEPGDLVDLTGAIACPSEHLDRRHLLVVRPDRYVAAVCTSDSEAHVLRGLSTYLKLFQIQETR